MLRLFHRMIVALVVIGWSSPAVADDAKLKFARYTGGGRQAGVRGRGGGRASGNDTAPFGEWKRTDRTTPIDRTKFLSITDARNVYARRQLPGPPRRAAARKAGQVQDPADFLKPPACLCGHGDKILYPKDAGRVDYEGELVIVIGKGGRDIPKEKAMEHVFGVPGATT